MILAASRRVKRVLWLIFGGLALLAAAVLFRSGPAGDAAARVEAPPAAPSVLPNVRVKHEFIEVPLPTPRTSLARSPQRSAPVAKTRPQVAPRVRATADGVRIANAVSKDEPSERRASLLVRAGRAIVGDGKHRPEPFPRIKKD
jgi:hypothetical protein